MDNEQNELFEIMADTVTVEVTDAATGKTYAAALEELNALVEGIAE